MAKEFNRRGIPSVAVYSNAAGEFSEERNAAIEKLVKGEINVIFSVDMFNEGVDIPAVDMVLFLRPTESPIVFLQQLGRGLRTEKGKGFFTQKEGNVLALRDELRAVVANPVFVEQFKDVIQYRAMDYYQRRYRGRG